MTDRSAALIKTLIFTLLVPGTVTVYVPYRLLDRVPRPASWVALAAGLCLSVPGLGVYLRCAWEFVKDGRGTPAPIDAPKKLVVSGLNRFVRNPMYVGVASMVLGESIMFGSRVLLIYAAGLAVMFNLFVMFYEEPTLRKKFGANYDEYCRRVPRWIPRLRIGVGRVG
ncbi:MAG TPA: isoprenylcysteine carboxylmethyltransferase family protein [Terriglobia bacterium]|nr:isoprenylcysteine carboxylmethyltransferase family protein [Terriglobia bacterium]